MPHHRQPQQQSHQGSTSDDQKTQDLHMAGRKPATMVGGMRVSKPRRTKGLSDDVDENEGGDPHSSSTNTTDMDIGNDFRSEEERLQKQDQIHELKHRTEIDKNAAIRDQQRAEAQRESHPPPQSIRTQDNRPIQQPSFRH